MFNDMLKKILFLVVLINITIPAEVPSEIIKYNFDKDRFIRIAQFKFHEGDDTNWSKINFDDSQWQSKILIDISSIEDEKYWLRLIIDCSGDVRNDHILGLFVMNIPSALEIYWNGSLIGKNGIIGNGHYSNQAGKVRSSMMIGSSNVKTGANILAIRISNFDNLKTNFYSSIIIGSNPVLQAYRINKVSENVFYMGVFFTATLFCIAVFIGGWRHKSFLILGANTFFMFLISLWGYLIHQELITVNLFNTLDPFFYYGLTIADIILILFILHFFELHKKWHYLIPPVIIFVIYLIVPLELSDLLNIRNITIILYMYGSWIILSRLKENIPGTYPLLSAILLMLGQNVFSLISDFFKVGGLPFLINFIFNILTTSLIIIAVSRKIQQQTKRYHEMLLKAQRLEAELLKKSIQPHFISNTLLSLKSWLTNDPSKAEKLIEALSEEFDIINQVSSEKEVPIEKEIELCNYHLELMGYRRDASYKLSTMGVNPNNKIPPMIFHTLIENGLTHAYKPKENGVFTLISENGNSFTKYILKNDGSRFKRYADQSTEKIEEGLGIKYVKYRLEENYPGKWEMNYGLNNGFWEVIIKIYS
ncbi:MAG: histidine kinase [bacterium]